jgi:GTP cyclohydrolase I
MGYGLSSQMLVNRVGGWTQANSVAAGNVLWTLDGDRTVRTSVRSVTAVKGRDAVDVITDHTTFTASPDLLLATPGGWVPARGTRRA